MKKLFFRVGGIGFAAFVLLGGCHSDAASGGADTSAVDSFIQSIAQAGCDWEFKCCKDPEIKTLEGSKFTTKEQCLPYHQLAQENALYLDRLAVRQGRLRVDATHAAACLQQQTSRACNPAAGTVPPPTPTATDCAKVFAGNTPVGAECIYAKECVDGARCVNDGAAVGRGVCVPFQKTGEICNASSDCDPSVENIYCARQDFKCHVRGKVGEACAYTTDTGTPSLPLLLECDQTTRGAIFCDPTSKTCATPPGDGQPCLTPPLPPGVSSRCNPDPTLMLVCDSATGTGGTCRAPGQAGADCSTLPCAADLFCMRSGTTSICTAPPGLGQPCPNGQCAKPYFCNFNRAPAVCDQPAGLGQDCSQVTCDKGLFCDSTGGQRVCKSQLADGSSCLSSIQCVSLICAGAPSTCQPRQTIAACTGR